MELSINDFGDGVDQAIKTRLIETPGFIDERDVVAIGPRYAPDLQVSTGAADAAENIAKQIHERTIQLTVPLTR